MYKNVVGTFFQYKLQNNCLKNLITPNLSLDKYKHEIIIFINTNTPKIILLLI